MIANRYLKEVLFLRMAGSLQAVEATTLVESEAFEESKEAIIAAFLESDGANGVVPVRTLRARLREKSLDEFRHAMEQLVEGGFVRLSSDRVGAQLTLSAAVRIVYGSWLSGTRSPCLSFFFFHEASPSAPMKREPASSSCSSSLSGFARPVQSSCRPGP